jgi:high-affinity Fe2+/Pb2+ permease
VLHWLVEKILAVANFLPALFVEQNSLRFEIVRGLFGLLFVLLVLIVFAWWQKRSSLSRYLSLIASGRGRNKS